MTNLFSTLYCVAIEKSIPNEATRRFKIELALFDSYYRALRRLLMIAQSDESINENDNDANDNDKAKDEKDENENEVKNEMKDKII